MKDNEMTSVLEFLKEIDKFKQIKRATKLKDDSRQENDAEHTWHMCMFGMLLHKGLSVEVDLSRSIELMLIHDLVEIYAGDTPAHGSEGKDTQKKREADAAVKLFSILPESSKERIDGLWKEFSDAKTNESRFANAMDRIQAFALGVFGSGKAWKKYKVTEEMSRNRNKMAMEFDPFLKEVCEKLYKKADEKEMWKKEK